MSDETEDDFDEMDMAAAIAAEQAEKAGEADASVDFDDLDDMDMEAAMAGEPTRQAAAQAEAAGGSSEPQTLGSALSEAQRSGAVQDISVDLTAVLGTAEMKVSNLLKIGRGAVIELDRRVGDTVEIRVSGQSIARGEVVVVEDHLAVSITELVKT